MNSSSDACTVSAHQPRSTQYTSANGSGAVNPAILPLTTNRMPMNSCVIRVSSETTVSLAPNMVPTETGWVITAFQLRFRCSSRQT